MSGGAASSPSLCPSRFGGRKSFWGATAIIVRPSRPQRRQPRQRRPAFRTANVFGTALSGRRRREFFRCGAQHDASSDRPKLLVVTKKNLKMLHPSEVRALDD